MIKQFVVVFLFSIIKVYSQTDYQQEILQFQKDLNAEYVNPEESPLTPEKQKSFEGHHFYPIDSTYRVTA